MSSSSPSVRPQDSCAKLLYFGIGCVVPEVQLPAGSRSVCRHRGGAPSLPAAPSFTCDESGHFTSLSVHGQETCQSKTPPWLVKPAHHPPSAPCSKASQSTPHTSRLQLGGRQCRTSSCTIAKYGRQWMVNPHLFQDETKKRLEVKLTYEDHT